MNYLYILGTVLFTVYGQLVVKWQMNQAGPMPVGLGERAGFLAHLLVNPWIITSLSAAFLAFLCWIGALSKFQLSHAYPFTSLSFVLVLIFSGLLFSEAVTWPKVLGLTLIIAGLAVGAHG